MEVVTSASEAQVAEVPCVRCGGEGIESYADINIPPPRPVTREPCPDCHGTGRLYWWLMRECLNSAHGEAKGFIEYSCDPCGNTGWLLAVDLEGLIRALLTVIGEARSKAHIGINWDKDRGYLIMGENGISIVPGGWCDTLTEALATTILRARDEYSRTVKQPPKPRPEAGK